MYRSASSKSPRQAVARFGRFAIFAMAEQLRKKRDLWIYILSGPNILKLPQLTFQIIDLAYNPPRFYS